MPKVEIMQGIFLILSLVMGFLYLNSEDPVMKDLSQLVLFLLVSGAFLFIVFLTTPSLKTIQLESASEFFDEYASGLIFGVGIAGAASILALGLDKVINFTGSISAISMALMSDTSVIFLVHILPFVETMILVGITIVLGSFLGKRVPYSYVVAGVIASLVFAAFHFAAVSGGDFEYSVNGFIDFISSPSCSSISPTGECLPPHGAIVHFSFGLITVALFLGYKSFILPYAAHHINNLASAIFILGFTPLLVSIIIIDIGIFVLVVYRKKLKRWSQFSMKNLTTGL